jgi:hypothetical protein
MTSEREGEVGVSSTARTSVRQRGAHSEERPSLHADADADADGDHVAEGQA